MTALRTFGAILLALVANGSGANTTAPPLCVWSGASGGDWSVAGNWSCPGGPATGDALEFPDGATTFAMNLDIPELTVESLNFSGSGGGYTLTGAGKLTVTGTAAISSRAIAPHKNALTFASGLILGAPTAVIDTSTGAGGRLDLSGAIDLSGSVLSFVWDSPVPPTFVYADISGNGGLAVNGNGGDVGLYLYGNNSFIGPVTVNSGYLNIQHAHALGAEGSLANGTTVGAGGTLRLSVDTANEYLTLASGSGQSGNGNVQAVGVRVWGGPVVLVNTGSETTKFNLLDGEVRFTGPVTGTGGIRCCARTGGKVGLTSSGSTYSGPSRFDLSAGGTLLVLADGALSPNSAVILGGTTGSTLDMGSFSGTAASFTGSLGSTLKITTGHTLTVTGAVALDNTTLSVTVAGSPANGTVFTILDNTGAGAITGTFNGLPEGALLNVGGVEMIISYAGGTGNDVTLTVQVQSAALTGAVSRKVHGGAGTFDLPLSLVPTAPTTEPRQGPAATIVMTFDRAITGADAAVTEGTATAGVPSINGNDVVVDLSGVVNVQYVTLSLTNVTSAGGAPAGSGAVRIGFLAGDVNGNRVVTLSDVLGVNAALAQLVGPSNYLRDVNVSGTLSLADKLLVNANLTKALDPP